MTTYVESSKPILFSPMLVFKMFLHTFFIFNIFFLSMFYFFHCITLSVYLLLCSSGFNFITEIFYYFIPSFFSICVNSLFKSPLITSFLSFAICDLLSQLLPATWFLWVHFGNLGSVFLCWVGMSFHVPPRP